MAGGVVTEGVVTIGPIETIGTINVVVTMGVLTTRVATTGLDTKTKGGGTTRCCGCSPQGSPSSTIFHSIRFLLITSSSFCLPIGLPGLIFTFLKLRNAPAYLAKLCGRDTYSNMTQRTTARTSWGARRDHATKEGMVTKQRS